MLLFEPMPQAKVMSQQKMLCALLLASVESIMQTFDVQASEEFLLPLATCVD